MKTPSAPAETQEHLQPRILRLLGRYRYLLTLLALLAVFAVSSLPYSLLPKIRGWDKPLHMVEYFFIGLVLLNITTHGFLNLKARTIAIAWAAVVLIALLDEFNQFWVPGRAPDAMDLVASISGGVAAILPVLLVRWIYNLQGRERTTHLRDG